MYYAFCKLPYIKEILRDHNLNIQEISVAELRGEIKILSWKQRDCIIPWVKISFTEIFTQIVSS